MTGRRTVNAARLAAPESVYTISQIANSLGVCAKTVRREIERGALKSIPVGRQIRITSSAYAAYLHDRAHNFKKVK